MKTYKARRVDPRTLKMLRRMLNGEQLMRRMDGPWRGVSTLYTYWFVVPLPNAPDFVHEQVDLGDVERLARLGLVSATPADNTTYRLTQRGVDIVTSGGVITKESHHPEFFDQPGVGLWVMKRHERADKDGAA